LWGSLKDKVYKTNPHTLEELRHNTAARFKQFPGKNSRELTTMCSAGTLSAFGQEGNIFSICCSTGEFLLDFVKVVITAIASVQLTDRDAGLGARAAERVAAASRTGRKIISLYVVKFGGGRSRSKFLLICSFQFE
jgi:hypothetical protein